MYGLVNKGLEELVRAQFGDELWTQIRTRAGVDEQGFVSMQPYPDTVTYSLAIAASEVLERPLPELLVAFGEHWIRYTAREGYGELFEMFGDSFGEFISNLDRMHARIGLSYPELRPPSFVTRELDAGHYELEYHSSRDALAPMIIGLLTGLGDIFGVTVEVRHTGTRAELGHDRFAIHTRPRSPSREGEA